MKIVKKKEIKYILITLGCLFVISLYLKFTNENVYLTENNKTVNVTENEIQPKTNPGKISFEESKEFMVERCRNINQQLIKSFVSNFDGNDVYMFFTLSTDRPGYSCVSLMTPFKLEILSTDCNLNEVKVSEWNNIPGSPKIYL